MADLDSTGYTFTSSPTKQDTEKFEYTSFEYAADNPGYIAPGDYNAFVGTYWAVNGDTNFPAASEDNGKLVLKTTPENIIMPSFPYTAYGGYIDLSYPIYANQEQFTTIRTGYNTIYAQTSLGSKHSANLTSYVFDSTGDHVILLTCAGSKSVGYQYIRPTFYYSSSTKYFDKTMNKIVKVKLSTPYDLSTLKTSEVVQEYDFYKQAGWELTSSDNYRMRVSPDGRNLFLFPGDVYLPPGFPWSLNSAYIFSPGNFSISGSIIRMSMDSPFDITTLKWAQYSRNVPPITYNNSTSRYSRFYHYDIYTSCLHGYYFSPQTSADQTDSTGSYVAGEMYDYGKFPTDFQFSSDGRKVFILPPVMTEIYQYDLANPYDFTNEAGMTLKCKLNIPKTFFAAFDFMPSFDFNSDGTELYLCSAFNAADPNTPETHIMGGRLGQRGNYILKYNLSVPWELNSAVLTCYFDYQNLISADCLSAGYSATANANHMVTYVDATDDLYISSNPGSTSFAGAASFESRSLKDRIFKIKQINAGNGFVNYPKKTYMCYANVQNTSVTISPSTLSDFGPHVYEQGQAYSFYIQGQLNTMPISGGNTCIKVTGFDSSDDVTVMIKNIWWGPWDRPANANTIIISTENDITLNTKWTTYKLTRAYTTSAQIAAGRWANTTFLKTNGKNVTLVEDAKTTVTNRAIWKPNRKIDFSPNVAPPFTVTINPNILPTGNIYVQANSWFFFTCPFVFNNAFGYVRPDYYYSLGYNPTRYSGTIPLLSTFSPAAVGANTAMSVTQYLDIMGNSRYTKANTKVTFYFADSANTIATANIWVGFY